MTLCKHMKDNNTRSKDDPYYNESFCHIVCDYLSSYDYTSADSKFLKRNGYCKSDFNKN